ncbi:MAG: site-specific integrase [Oxalobacter formigenes]|nr:site-specific integrase [Oxalobacter formigenes]
MYPPGGGKVLRGSTGTEDKRKAQEFHDRLKANLWDQVKLGYKHRYIWNDAVIRFVREKAHLASIETIKSHFRWLDPYLNGVQLLDITRSKIDQIAQIKLNEGVSPTTANRVIEIIRSVLKSAEVWEWIDHAPKIQKMAQPTKRVRWLTKEEASRLLQELPHHLSEMAAFSLETGLRRSNVTGLKWSQVDLARKMAWIHPDEAKAKRAIPVPLSDTAVEILKRNRLVIRETGYSDYVFVYKGKPVFQTATKAWKKALHRAGIQDFRWHDLRHTWASWHIQRGTPKEILKELGGWETSDMVERYAHFSAEHLSPWAKSFTKTGTF